MIFSTRSAGLFFTFLVLTSVLLFQGCGSDRAGDEIGAVRDNNYPENYDVRRNEIFIAGGISGPEDVTTFPSIQATPWSKYSQGSKSRMAILLTDSSCSWLGLAHGLKTMGVPFIITNNYQQAIQHKVVMVYPVISGAVLSPEALQALAAHPRTGGTLIGTQVLGALNEIFGFDEPVPSKQHFEINITEDPENPVTSEFTDPNELQISLGNKERFKETIGTYSYSKNQLPPLATFEDKTAAITQKLYEGGVAYAFGFDIGYLIMKGHNMRHEVFNRAPMNSFEPTIDVILRLLKNMYITGNPDAAYVTTVPYNKSLSVCITHNINFDKALDDAVKYAEMEKNSGMRSTYFIQTKYIRDKSTWIFSSMQDLEKIEKISSFGMDIQSNSVSGSPLFDQFDQGTGKEVYPEYRPYVMAWDKTYHGTIFGEMRVSRFLLDRYALNPVLAFRSSHLYTPFTYPQSLLASGYRFSSSVAANAALTHFPFQLNYNREYEAELDAFEFPVTDGDEVPPFTVLRAKSAISLANKIARYGGCFIGQVHPNPTGWKVQEEFVKAMKDIAWFGTINDFGLWWAARNEVTLDVNHVDGRRVVNISVPKRMEGLAVMLPVRSTPVSVEGGGKHSVDGKLIIFELAEGNIRIVLDN